MFSGAHRRRVTLLLGQRLGSGDGERKTLLTRQIAPEPLPASVLFAFESALSCVGILGMRKLLFQFINFLLELRNFALKGSCHSKRYQSKGESKRAENVHSGECG